MNECGFWCMLRGSQDMTCMQSLTSYCTQLSHNADIISLGVFGIGLVLIPQTVLIDNNPLSLSLSLSPGGAQRPEAQ